MVNIGAMYRLMMVDNDGYDRCWLMMRDDQQPGAEGDAPVDKSIYYQHMYHDWLLVTD